MSKKERDETDEAVARSERPRKKRRPRYRHQQPRAKLRPR